MSLLLKRVLLIYYLSIKINNQKIDKVGLHRVENPNPNKTSVSLHVYIPPLKQCKAFDQRTGSARECKLTFYSKCGKITYEDEETQKHKGKLNEC